LRVQGLIKVSFFLKAKSAKLEKAKQLKILIISEEFFGDD
jgi:BRCT domain type II-containing protein